MRIRPRLCVLVVITSLIMVCNACAQDAPPPPAAGEKSAEPEDSPLREMGNIFALIGIAILLVQPVLAARIRWIERPFGLDAIYRLHKLLGIVAGSLIVCHPLLLAASGDFPSLLTRAGFWFIVLGKIGVLVVAVLVLTALLYGALRLRFETWRRVHDVLAIGLISIAVVHSGFAGGLFDAAPVAVLWVALGVGAVWIFTWHRFIRPAQLRRRAWRVTAVTPENHNVTTLTLEPPVGEAAPDYLPGQFHFLTLYRKSGPVEEHPFTISSSATQKGVVTSTIKASGDFTATVKDTQAGDLAARQGPFGRFSCALHPDEKDLVFIAGGIGITPFMSMLRWMRDTGTGARVTLVWGNRKERDLVFRDELDAITRSGSPSLSIVHVLSESDATWTGEKGYVDEEKIGRLVGNDLSGKTFYLCGPPTMMKKLTATLRKVGVPKRRIRSERFAL